MTFGCVLGVGVSLNCSHNRGNDGSVNIIISFGRAGSANIVCDRAKGTKQWEFPVRDARLWQKFPCLVPLALSDRPISIY